MGMSSKPARAMSCGTRTPASASAARQPMAIMSLPQKTAVGRCARVAISLPARQPDSSVKSPGSTSSGAPGSSSAKAER